MNIETIKANILPEDKAMAAVHTECSYRFVDMILEGKRSADTETAKKVLEKLIQLARINMRTRNKKNQLIAA